MLTGGSGVKVQPVMRRLGSLWYYEWFAGVAQANWHSPASAVEADTHMLDTLRAYANAIRGLPIGVNLGFLTVAYRGLEFVKELSGLLPQGSIIEVTEHATAAASSEEVKGFFRTCAAIKKAGFCLALDDCDANGPFGDAAIWDCVDVDIIKVDMRSPTALEVASTAQVHSRQTIYECVESARDRLQAVSLGAHGVQGYAIARPMPLSPSGLGAFCA